MGLHPHLKRWGIQWNKLKNAASISNKRAGEIYGLEIINDDIQNIKENKTRFFLVKKKGIKLGFENKLEKSDKSSIIIETRDIPGALYKCLGAFATNNINLTKLESRPSKNKKFDYIFYIDFEGSLNEKKVQLALEEIRFFSETVKILGEYKKFS